MVFHTKRILGNMRVLFKYKTFQQVMLSAEEERDTRSEEMRLLYVALTRAKEKLIITLVAIDAIGLIFSYCLFVPAIFAAICIYCFIKDLYSHEKKYLKIRKK